MYIVHIGLHVHVGPTRMLSSYYISFRPTLTRMRNVETFCLSMMAKRIARGPCFENVGTGVKPRGVQSAAHWQEIE